VILYDVDAFCEYDDAYAIDGDTYSIIIYIYATICMCLKIEDIPHLAIGKMIINH